MAKKRTPQAPATNSGADEISRMVNAYIDQMEAKYGKGCWKSQPASADVVPLPECQIIQFPEERIVRRLRKRTAARNLFNHKDMK